MPPESIDDQSGRTTVPLTVTSQGTEFGAYRLLQVIGSGGMGEVWLAEQTRPVQRTVAVKVIKPGMDSAQVIARFEAERQALALMSHPAIATVLDGGTTPDHRPFFAMEFVKGEPITAYCDRHRLDMPARLALFLQVCEGVQHAHQKGIIHRDLKPSNVLVTIVGAHPTPKIIDFGLAKAMGPSLTNRTLFTELGVLMGTPEYMSPEQAEMGALDIDTRTDVYALGVMLYELLTGALPYDREALRQVGLDAVRRVIRDTDTPLPSARLSQLGPSTAESARNRNTDPSRHIRLLRGDLDWIVMRALEKDRTRRYSAVSDFAADVQRHIDFQPVLAGPPSTAYRVSKFVRRHRTGVSIAALVLVLVIGFGVALVIQTSRVAVERDLATQARDRAQRIAGFLTGLFEASDPNIAKGKTVTALDLLETGRKRLESELKDEPATRAELLHTIGGVYLAQGRLDAAQSALDEALAVRKSFTGPDRADLAETLNELANIHRARNDLDRSDELNREVLRIRQDVFGPEHVTVARSLGSLGNGAFSRGRLAEAEQYYRQAGDLASRLGQRGDAARARLNLSAALSNQGRLSEAIVEAREATSALRETLGVTNTITLRAMNNLGAMLYRADQFDEAERIQRLVLDTQRTMVGPVHFDVSLALYNLGMTVAQTGRAEEASRMLSESLTILRQAIPAPSQQEGYTLSGLGGTLRSLGRFDESERRYLEAVAVFKKAADAGPAEVAVAIVGLGELAQARGQPAEAERHFRQVLNLPFSPDGTTFFLEVSRSLLARLLCERGAADEGQPLAQAALESLRKSGRDEWETDWAEALVGRCLVAARKFDEAEGVLTRVYAELLGPRGAAADETRYVAATLATLYEQRGQSQQASSWRAKAGSR